MYIWYAYIAFQAAYIFNFPDQKDRVMQTERLVTFHATDVMCRASQRQDGCWTVSVTYTPHGSKVGRQRPDMRFPTLFRDVADALDFAEFEGCSVLDRANPELVSSASMMA